MKRDPIEVKTPKRRAAPSRAKAPREKQEVYPFNMGECLGLDEHPLRVEDKHFVVVIANPNRDRVKTIEFNGLTDEKTFNAIMQLLHDAKT